MAYDRPYKTRRGAPAKSADHYHGNPSDGTRANRPYYLYSHADITKREAEERKAARAARAAAKKGTGGRRRRRGSRYTRRR